MTRRLHLASFDDEHVLLAAIERCRRAGLEIVDAWTPHPVHGLDQRMGIPRSRLTLVCFAGGLAGLCLGLLFQYWSSASDWPIDVGGKPFDSLPAFLPVAFELTVLCAGLSTALALLVRSGLRPGRKVRTRERVSDDRFVLAIAARDPTRSPAEVEHVLTLAGALRAWEEVNG